MRWWLLATVAVVALTACTDAAILGPDSTDEGETAGNTALFCRAWREARRTAVNVVEGEESRFDWYNSARALDEAMEEYDGTVPVEIRSEWDRVYDTYWRVSDLMFTTGFGEESVLRPDHIEMVFGSVGPEPIFARAMDAIEAIDEWSITACGDFCSRWPELEDAVRLDGAHFIIEGENEVQSIAQMEGAIRAGSMLVPPALADAWGIAATLKSDFLDMYREIGREFLEGVEGEQRFRDWMGMDSGEAFEVSIAAVETMAAWVDVSCGSTLPTGGAPGSLSVRIRPHDDLTHRMILLALLPPGTEVDTAEDLTDLLGLWCTTTFEKADDFEREVARQARDSGRDPEEIADEWLRPEPLRPRQDDGEYHVGSVCHQIRHEEELAVPGGSYELFAGTFIGEPGSFGFYFAAPERCGQMTVAVDGDTVVDLPLLEQCGLVPSGRPEEIARRTTAPLDPGGTLQVEFPSAFAPEGFDFCERRAVLLASGTTLNAIGRGDAWPAGGFNLGLGSVRYLDSRDPCAPCRQ